ncbi:MAG TPA: hypothetical protein VFP14_11280 [Novosphingobium sp.]|nr:hypothetical protein [Novosphingobium sp.]
MIRKSSLALALALLGSTMAHAQTETAASTTASRAFTVTGNVPVICAGGALTGGDSTFALGVLVNTTTGLLRTDLAAPNKVLSGAFCSALSTISIAATRMTAQNVTAPAPSGFSTGVDFTATASGWTTTPASVNTAASTNPEATQSRATPFTGDITVGLSNFATTGGSTLRPVADTSYLGSVTVTLTAAN